MQPLTAADLHSVFVINLQHREDRWANIQAHLRDDLGWSLQVQRHLAVDTRDWSAAEDKYASLVAPEQMAAIRRNSRFATHELSPGAVGCAMSHLALWSRLAAHRDDAFMFVMEDDAVWHSAAPRLSLGALVDRVNALAAPWDVLFLGGTPLHHGPVGPGCVRVEMFWEAHAYIIRKSAALRLLQGVLPLREPLDWVMSRAAREGLNMLMLAPGLMGQRGGHYSDPRRLADSDVQNEYLGA